MYCSEDKEPIRKKRTLGEADKDITVDKSVMNLDDALEADGLETTLTMLLDRVERGLDYEPTFTELLFGPWEDDFDLTLPDFNSLEHPASMARATPSLTVRPAAQPVSDLKGMLNALGLSPPPKLPQPGRHRN